METREYIESGILELYVFGNLTEVETLEVSKIAASNKDIREEILSIEKAVVSLSYSVAPYLSAANFLKIKNKLIQKHGGVIDMKPKSIMFNYLGWAAAVLLMLGVGYQYNESKNTEKQLATVKTEKSKLKQDLNGLELKNKASETILAVVRDENNIVVPLGGQTVAPLAKAKIYWNKNTEVVFVDASGLPEPPEGKEYQIWALKLNPLTPTSIGMLVNFKSNDSKIFEVQKANGAQAFGITLEPKGGSSSPTMEQLYTLGVVKV
jgi:anti-sigma-K factor RskA